jgi:2-polyprenyl-6-methoxyphenol hydroxylase-like FAD-dependent oxidoreductase
VKALIIGAGMAGLTLAARLCQQGRSPVIVERALSIEGGYALGLYPLESCVLHGLGTYQRLVEQAQPLERYELSSASGQRLQSLDLSVLTGDIGPLLMISRSDLLRLLESSCTDADLRRGVTVSSLVQHQDGVEVRFDDGTTEPFDAVVACDGADSSTRELIFGPAKGYDSGWVLWTWWADAKRFDPTVAREWWGAGCIFGAYPAPGQVMCAAGGPSDALRGNDVRSLLQYHFADLINHVPLVGAAIADLGEAYSWACVTFVLIGGSTAGSRSAETPLWASCRRQAWVPPTPCGQRQDWPTSFPVPTQLRFRWRLRYMRSGAEA